MADMQMREITSVRELIETLGGPKATGDLLGATPQAVVNWRAENALPARKFLAHRSLLQNRGFTAPASLWGMEPAATGNRRAASVEAAA